MKRTAETLTFVHLLLRELSSAVDSVINRHMPTYHVKCHGYVYH